MGASQVSLRTIFTICFGVVVVVALVYGALQTRLAITLTLVAAMIAVALDHAVAMLQRRRLPRWAAIAIVCLLVLGVGGSIAATIIPSAAAQTQILARSIPDLVDNIRKTHSFHVLDDRFGLNDAIDRLGKDAPTLIYGAVNAVVEVVVASVAVVLLAVFMLIFGAPLIERVLDALDPAQGPRPREILATVYRLLGGYIGGIILIAGINSVATATFLAILHMPFFLPLAMVSGLASMVPYVGSLMTSITISLLALASLGVWPAVACGIFFITFGQIEGNLLGPFIFRRTAKVNPLVTVLAILFFGTMGGIMGAFLAIPLVGMLQIVLHEILSGPHRQLVTIERAAG
jgi:putative heme transporter